MRSSCHSAQDSKTSVSLKLKLQNCPNVIASLSFATTRFFMLSRLAPNLRSQSLIWSSRLHGMTQNSKSIWPLTYALDQKIHFVQVLGITRTFTRLWFLPAWAVRHTVHTSEEGKQYFSSADTNC